MTAAAAEAETPEFSRPFDLNPLGSSWREITIEATDAERAALARRFDLPALHKLRVVLKLRRTRGGDYVALQGRLTASAEQSCVVTLAPVAAEIDEEMDMLFGPPSEEEGRLDAEGGFNFEMEAAEPLDSDVLDLGELAAQTLSLALDPYPHAAEAGSADHYDPEEEETEKPVSPFAVLADLKGKRES